MLHLRAIEPDTLGLLKSLMGDRMLANHFLVGGTGLALQIGHRLSVDLDLFTHQPFESELLLEALRAKYAIQPLTTTTIILIVVANGIKVDCVQFK